MHLLTKRLSRYINFSAHEICFKIRFKSIKVYTEIYNFIIFVFSLL